MAQQLIPFQPADSANFQFQATVDGQIYTFICPFNQYRQEYYLYVYDLSQQLVFARPLVASPDVYNINLGESYFTDSIIYRASSQTIEIPGIPVQVAKKVTAPPPAPVPPPPPPPPPSPDPYFADVALLLHGEGAPGSSTIVDSSSHHIAMTTVGSVSIEDTVENFSGGAISIVAGNWLESTDSVFNFDSRSFTVEGWFYLPTLASSDRGHSLFCSGRPGSTVDGTILLWVHTDGTIELYSAEAFGNNPRDTATGPGVFPAAQWVFLSISQVVIGSDPGDAANQTYIHLNGILVASRIGPVTSAYPASIEIGNYGDGSESIPFTGYIQEYRVTINVARYGVANYAVPTARFPNS